MSTQAVESPLRDPVSVSCSRCCFMDYGRYQDLEEVAMRHAREAQHPVGLYLNLVLVGTWRPGGDFVGGAGQP